MNGRKTILVCLGVLLVMASVLIFALKEDETTEEIMPFVKDNSVCMDCHSREELETKYRDPAKACDRYCYTCHTDKEAHHPVGMAIDFKTASGFFFGDDRKLVCVSCHDLNLPRLDDKPWKARSLFGRMFRRQPRYKTYYLIKNNSKGELCKECH